MSWMTSWFTIDGLKKWRYVVDCLLFEYVMYWALILGDFLSKLLNEFEYS